MKRIIVMNRAVFLDRDGVINKIVYHQDLGILDTPFTPSQFELLPDVGKSIWKLKTLGFLTILVSNQPGIAKGHFNYKTFQAMEKKMFTSLNRNKAKLDGAYYCFHHPEGRVKKYRKKCNCRKPKPGLLLKAAHDFDLDLKNSFLIGDGITDIQAGKSVGCITILLGNHKCELCRLLNEKRIKPDFIVPNLHQATKIIQQISFRSSANVGEVPRSGILTTRIDARGSKLETGTHNLGIKSSSVELRLDQLRYEHQHLCPSIELY